MDSYSATQSALPPALHIAIILDGNGRWATRRGLPRTAGHVEGANAVREVVETAARLGVGTLTLYAFSAANWSRPTEEVSGLLFLLRRYLFSETRRLIEHSIRLSVIGRRERLAPALLRSIERSERASAGGSRMHLRLAIDYSAQGSLVAAAERARTAATSLSADAFRRLIAAVEHASVPAPDVDFLIRTGGEQRLSDFLLFECAYAELYFTDCLWPDFDAAAFERALADFAGRRRRFGALPEEAS